ncbi:MAG: hypothetical protein ACPGJF_16990 [Sinimarinibacterium flocculans]|uniref:hypothetical protein n=1 Tax=Sinimarinibacterium flocculans TaxID=985250 RepID=UPI003C632348
MKLDKTNEFLRKAAYVALAQHKQKSKLQWYAEVALSDFRKLYLSKRKASTLRSELSDIRKEYRELREEYERLQKHNEALEAANARLMKNIEEDTRPERYVRSPKNYHNAADDHAFKASSPFAFQGGLAGLEKK